MRFAFFAGGALALLVAGAVERCLYLLNLWTGFGSKYGWLHLLDGYTGWISGKHPHALIRAPGDEVARACGLAGGPERDDVLDLAQMCQQRPGSACLEAASITQSGGRRRRQNQLVLPRALYDRACRCSAQMAGQGWGGTFLPPACEHVLPFLNVMVMHTRTDWESGRNGLTCVNEWITTEILPSFGRPLRVVHSEPTWPGLLLNAEGGRPAANDSLVVLWHGLRTLMDGKAEHFPLEAYVQKARQLGVRNIGLLHLNHELICEDKDKPGGEWFPCPYDLREHLPAYAGFDYVLRNYYSPAYARHSAYLPLGPVSKAQLRPQRQLRKASLRRTFCAAWVTVHGGGYRSSSRTRPSRSAPSGTTRRPTGSGSRCSSGASS